MPHTQNCVLPWGRLSQHARALPAPGCALPTGHWRGFRLRATRTASSSFRPAPPRPPRVWPGALTSALAGPGRGDGHQLQETSASPQPWGWNAPSWALGPLGPGRRPSGFFSLVLRGSLEAGASEFYFVCFTGICSVLGVKINRFSQVGSASRDAGCAGSRAPRHRLWRKCGRGSTVHLLPQQNRPNDSGCRLPRVCLSAVSLSWPRGSVERAPSLGSGACVRGARRSAV